MRNARPYVRADALRLFTRTGADRVEYWTEAAGEPPAVYGERWQDADGRWLRAIDPNRSKLGAALVRGWAGPLPRPGERWLYLGAASGTTASHVADLLGPTGVLFAVEKSPRPFARLLGVADRWTNLLPILGDVRDPDAYLDLVEPVDGIYADVSQPDQTGLLLAHAERFLRSSGGAFLLALKIPSLGREQGPTAHLHAAERRLEARFLLEPGVRLEPFHRGHFLLGGTTADGARPSGPKGQPPARHRPPRSAERSYPPRKRSAFRRGPRR